MTPSTPTSPPSPPSPHSSPSSPSSPSPTNLPISTRTAAITSAAHHQHQGQQSQHRERVSQSYTPRRLRHNLNNDIEVIEKTPRTPVQGTRNAPLVVSDSGSVDHRHSNSSSGFARETSEEQESSSTRPTPSSRKLQRAAIMVNSPSAGRGLRARSGSFGAGLNNVPPPIHTQGQVPTQLSGAPGGNLMQPPPYQQATGFGLNQMPPPNQVLMGNGGAIHNANQNTNPHQQVLGSANGAQLAGACARPLINPYALRADEIGPRHGIPGVGSVQSLLTPPGWQLGDPPINEEQAKAIYARSRLQARINLNETAHEFDNLPAEERQRRVDAKNEAWDANRKLDEELLFERIKIHNAYKDYWQGDVHGAPSRNEISPALVQPPMPGFQGYPLTPSGHFHPVVNRVGFFTNVAPANPPLSGGHLYSRLRSIQQGFHVPQGSPISPSVVDPSLVPQTFEAVVHLHHANRIMLSQLSAENDHYLHVWGSHFRGNGMTNAEATPAMQGRPAGVAGEGRELVARNQARSSVNKAHRASNLSQVEKVDPRNRVAAATTALPARDSGPVFQFPTSYIRSTRPDLARHEASNGHQPLNELARNNMKQNPSTCTADPGSWSERYREEIEKANLPPPTLNADVLRSAGLPVKQRSTVAKPSSVTTAETKKARGKPAVDPAEGYVISARSARALIAQGATDARKKPMRISQNTQTDAHGLSTAGKLSHPPLRQEERPQSSANNVGKSVSTTVGDEGEDTVEESNPDTTGSGGSDNHGKGISSTLPQPNSSQQTSKRVAASPHGLAKKRSKLDVDHSDD